MGVLAYSSFWVQLLKQSRVFYDKSGSRSNIKTRIKNPVLNQKLDTLDVKHYTKNQ